MKGSRIATCIALLLAVSLPSLSFAQGPHPNMRQGWLIGFGVGGGSAGISGDNIDEEREGGITGSFRAGYSFRPDISLELNSNGWSKEDSGVTQTFSVSTAAINYYPGSMGVVLRGGVGVGSADATARSGNTTLSVTESGFGFLLGAGYEFRVMRTFAIGPEVEFGWMTLDSFDANYVNGNIAFTWYFLPGQ